MPPVWPRLSCSDSSSMKSSKAIDNNTRKINRRLICIFPGNQFWVGGGRDLLDRSLDRQRDSRLPLQLLVHSRSAHLLDQKKTESRFGTATSCTPAVVNTLRSFKTGCVCRLFPDRLLCLRHTPGGSQCPNQRPASILGCCG